MTIGVLLTSRNHRRLALYLKFLKDSSSLRAAVDGTMKMMVLIVINNNNKSVSFQKLTELLEQKS